MTISIGQYKLDNSVALAPMAGVTDLPFRKLCRSFGAGYVVGEMLASDPVLRGSRKSQLRGVHLDEPVPRAIQIVGWDPATMAKAAEYNVDQGASIIDINMGCPAKKVCQRYAGSALLDQEDRVARILEAVVSAVDVPVTLKIRTGVSPEKRNGVKIAQIAEQSGVQALAVHGRTRACKYRGQAEYATIREICRSVSIPVFANGDINSCDQAAKVMTETGASGVMVGRGAHGAPWFPGNVAEFLNTGVRPQSPDFVEQMEVVLRHLDALYSFYGVLQGVRIARKHIKWYLEKLPQPVAIDTDVYRVETPQAQLGLVSGFYQRYSNFTENTFSHCQQKPFKSTMIAGEVETSSQGKEISSAQLVEVAPMKGQRRVSKSIDPRRSRIASVTM